MALPVGAIMKFVQKNAKPLAIGGGGALLGYAGANALNGGSNTPMNTTQDGKVTFEYQQYVDSSSNVNYNITSGGSTIISTDTASKVEPSTGFSPTQSASSALPATNMLLPALAVGGALVVAGVALWNK
jgi:hypothetical protein